MAPPILVSGLFLLPQGQTADYVVGRLDQCQLLPLRGVNVTSQLVDTCAEVRLSQRFYNPYAWQIEAVYVFPIDERAAVSSFTAHVGDRTIIGNVEEKQEARATYEAAKAQGHGAFLLEEVREDIFRVQVGNILPGQTVEIEISYVCELKVEGEDGALRFLLPTAVAPRYTPASDWRQEPIPSSMPARVADGLKVHLDAHTHSEIVSVTSPTHAIVVTKTSAKTASVDLAFGSVSLGSDLVILVHTDESNRKIATLVLEENTDAVGGVDTRACMLTLVPKFELDDVRTDIVFVIDRSGSMAGSQIQQARHAMELFLRSLPTDCYFNIVGFGNRYETLFAGPAKYSQETLNVASAHVRNMQANLGGTELMGPLQAINAMPLVAGYPRQVFVLTDGQVSNTEQVCQFVQGIKTARFFSLGIGADVSHALVEGIARNGKGTAAFVHSGEPMEGKVMRQLKQAIQPAITDVKIDWGISAEAGAAAAPPPVKSLLGYRKPDATEGPLMPAPFVVPPVFNGERFTVYCLLKHGVERPKRAIVRANTPDGPLEAEVALEEDDVVVGDIVHRLAARAILRDINDSSSFMHRSEGGTGFRVPSAETVKAFAVQLGKRYKLASKYTSFVAVEERVGARVPVFYARPVVEVPVAAQPVAYAPPPPFAMQMQMQTSSLGFHAQGRGGAMGGMMSAGMAAKRMSSAPAHGGLMDLMGAAPPPPPPSYGMMASGSFGGPPPPPPSARPMMAPPVFSAFSAPSQPSALFSSSPSAECAKMSLDDFDHFSAPLGSSMSNSNNNNNKSDNLFDLSDPFSAALPPPPPPAAPSAAAVATTSAPSAPTSDRDTLRALVPLQQFDGCFLLSPQLASAARKSLDVLKSAKPADISDETWATAIAVAVFAVLLSGLQEEWEMVADKARSWVRRGMKGRAQEVLQSAEAVVRG